MIQLFIPSKNRACQLHLLLESIQRNCSIFHITILYTYSDNEFKKGYEKLKKENVAKNVEWIFETNLREDYLNIIRKSKSEIFCHTCDDTVFYRKFTSLYEDVADILDERTICFSFRYGLNTIIQDYTTGRPQKKLLQNYFVDDQLIKWKWIDYPYLENNSFIFGQDGHCFRTGHWLDIVDSTNFDCFAQLESNLTLNQYHFKDFPYISSPLNSCLVSIPTNSVQGKLYHSKHNHISSEELNIKYISGYKLSLESIMRENIIGAHQDIKLQFKENI